MHLLERLNWLIFVDAHDEDIRIGPCTSKRLFIYPFGVHAAV